MLHFERFNHSFTYPLRIRIIIIASCFNRYAMNFNSHGDGVFKLAKLDGFQQKFKYTRIIDGLNSYVDI